MDAAINEAVIARAVAMMSETSPILILPPTSVGKSTEHTAFPGTLTLSHDTLTNMWLEIGASVHRAGVQRLLLLNSHGGQPQIVEVVCRELRIRPGMLAVGTMWSRITQQDDLFDPHERKHGIHGGEIETSVMLRLPDLVKMQHASIYSASVELEQTGGLLTPEGVGFAGRILCRGRLWQRGRGGCPARRNSDRSGRAVVAEIVRRDRRISDGEAATPARWSVLV